MLSEYKPYNVIEYPILISFLCKQLHRPTTNISHSIRRTSLRSNSWYSHNERSLFTNLREKGCRSEMRDVMCNFELSKSSSSFCMNNSVIFSNDTRFADSMGYAFPVYVPERSGRVFQSVGCLGEVANRHHLVCWYWKKMRDLAEGSLGESDIHQHAWIRLSQTFSKSISWCVSAGELERSIWVWRIPDSEFWILGEPTWEVMVVRRWVLQPVDLNC